MIVKSRNFVLFLTLVLGIGAPLFADDPPKAASGSTNPAAADPPATTTPATSSSSSSSAAPAAAPTLPHVALLREATQHSGMLSLWQKGNNLYAEMTGSEYNSEYIVLISISRGISVGDLIGGFSWNMGDDWLWTFRKVDDRVHVVRTNVRFKATPGFPEALAVRNAYTDSVLFSLPILMKGPRGGDLVNLSQVFMSDLPQISQRMPGFSFTSDRSAWAAVKSLPANVELEVAATYASSGRAELDTVPDSRGATINVHYSISKLQSTGYTPRLADDRVGYFLTVVKDFNKVSDRDQFVRYINRWQLEAPPGAGQAPYPPKQAIKFWIEKTVPHKYRPVVRAGIEEWNKAFERAGWINAIEVRQQEESDTWDPEDIRFNTFRWITAGAGFAMGPSRVNPRTGQILDADIIFDADFLTFWKEEFESLAPSAMVQMLNGRTPGSENAANHGIRFPVNPSDCRRSFGMSTQLAFGSAALASVMADPKASAAEQEKLILQGLKEVVMHEVGHTLGLKHNFKASQLHSLKDLNDPEKVKDGAIVASVMDYNPTNIVPKGWTQGNYYASTIGPYDHWAVEYGYKVLGGGTNGEVSELKKIASRSGEAALTYATDEDLSSNDPDPDANRWDLGGNALDYAKQRAQVVHDAMPALLERVTKEGEDYTQVRRAFGVLLGEYGNAMHYAARYVGGMLTSRSHKGDKDARPPIIPVEVSKQREAIALVEEHVFSHKPFEFPPELYNYLATTRWSHWGMHGNSRKDYPIHDVILQWQSNVLDQLLSPNTLERIHDTELKVSADADVLTTAELMERLTKAIFSELDTVKEGEFTNRKPAINSLRRNLQREYLRRLYGLAMGGGGGTISLFGITISSGRSAPDDCQTIAFAELSSLEARMSHLLKNNLKLDSYSRAHLMESASRTQKVLDAKLTLRNP